MIWDLHCHLSGVTGRTPDERMGQLIEFADRLGIDRVCIYMGWPFLANPTPEQFRKQNDDVLQALSHWHHRAFAFVFLNPRYPDESLAELYRCVRDGPMVGIKLWTALRSHEAALDPIIRRAAELKAVIFQHTWFKVQGNEPGESTPLDLVALAQRHPETPIICGHTGGQWKLGIRAIRAQRNLYADLAGSDPTAGYTEMAVRELGAERVIYGSDAGGRSFSSQLAKVLGADIPEAAKRLILGENLKRLMLPILQAKGMKGMIDANVTLFQWPFRRLRADDPGVLAEKLQAQGIKQAWAGSFEGLLHRDLTAVNSRLAEACKQQPLFLPFGSINPTLPGWEEDLRRCREEHGMRGIRLHPNFHGYKLHEQPGLRLLQLAAEERLLVQVALVMEDERTQHPLLRVPPAEVVGLPPVLRDTAGLRLVLLNAFRSVRLVEAKRLADAGEVYFDIAMLEGVGGITNLLQSVPPERVLFGSHAPLFYLESAVLKLKESALSDADRGAITLQNAQRLLGS